MEKVGNYLIFMFCVEDESTNVWLCGRGTIIHMYTSLHGKGMGVCEKKTMWGQNASRLNSPPRSIRILLYSLLTDGSYYQESMTQEYPTTVLLIVCLRVNQELCYSSLIYGPTAWKNKGYLKIDVHLHGIRGGTHRWKGNTYLDILVSWILDTVYHSTGNRPIRIRFQLGSVKYLA